MINAEMMKWECQTRVVLEDDQCGGQNGDFTVGELRRSARV